MNESAQHTTTVIVPGWRNSGAGHWQTLWASQMPHAVRVEQDDWLSPKKQPWVDRIAETILRAPGRVIVVAHSLGCIATAHLPPDIAERISGALLVAPADPERRCALTDFAPTPHELLPYPSILVASDTDPYCPVRLAGAYARAWGSEFVRLKSAGHINIASGHGHWPLGLALWQSLAQELPDEASQSIRAPAPRASMQAARFAV